MNEKTLKDTTVFDGHLIRVHVDDVELDNGMVAKREIVSHPAGSAWPSSPRKTSCCSSSSSAAPIRRNCWSCPPASWSPARTPSRP